MKPSVTVLIDTYNHERFIEEAVVSVVEQDFPASEMEILVVDDGSTDRTPEVLAKFAPRVRVLRKKNGGQASAFNLGIPEASGEIVAFLDGDDWWTRDKLSRVVKALEDEPGVGIIGHGIVIVGPGENEQVEILREGFRFKADTLDGARMLRRRGAFLGTSRMTIRADLLRRIGPVPEAIRVQADEYLFTLASVMAGARILEETLTYYRIHDANTYQIATFDPARMRAKQESLAALAVALTEALKSHGIDAKTREAITLYTEACADQLRLSTDGGWSWETVRTEWSLYQVAHPEAPLSHRAFKSLVLLGALAFPPKTFYSIRRRVTQGGAYSSARARLLPVPQMPHIERRPRSGS
jgi:glycosyltransferase involved in cell wall biosynthesis